MGAPFPPKLVIWDWYWVPIWGCGVNTYTESRVGTQWVSIVNWSPPPHPKQAGKQAIRQANKKQANSTIYTQNKTICVPFICTVFVQWKIYTNKKKEEKLKMGSPKQKCPLARAKVDNHPLISDFGKPIQSAREMSSILRHMIW